MMRSATTLRIRFSTLVTENSTIQDGSNRNCIAFLPVPVGPRLMAVAGRPEIGWDELSSTQRLDPPDDQGILP